MRVRKTVIMMICLLVTVSFMVPAGAYARREREDRISGRRKKKSAKYNLSELPVAQGPRKNIAVMDFQNKAGLGSQWNIGTGMSEMLTTALIDSGRFVVVERQAISDVLAEQDFGASDRTTEAGAAKIGKILNAQVLIRGAVTEFSTKTSGADTGFSIAGIGIGLSSSSAHVAVNIRVYDVTTGEVIDSIRCEGKASAGGVSADYSGSFSLGGGGFAKTPLGKATQKVINEAVYKIAAKMDNVPWQGKIVTVKGDTVYLNVGKRSNILPGNEFVVYKKGQDLIDPDTGISLGSEDEKVGRIQVVSVEEKFSKAQVVSGNIGAFKRGDIVRMN
ncbi:MAG: CsgG/HfaB family protein [Candidatus Omnitrophota bacterium]|nr:CsgG/HfaB family protein [Candidatus Omnitrophota bacterium]